MKKSLLLFPVLFLLISCGPVEQSVRDSIAASKGVIITVQAKYHDSCVAGPTQQPCVAINKAIDVQHLVKDALYTYCSFVSTDDPTKKCIPVKSALPALQSAVANLNQTTTDLKGLLK